MVIEQAVLSATYISVLVAMCFKYYCTKQQQLRVNIVDNHDLLYMVLTAPVCVDNLLDQRRLEATN